MTHRNRAANLNQSQRPPCVNHRVVHVSQSSVYRPMSVGRATTPVAWISRRRPSASISFVMSVIFGEPNHRPVGNKRPARNRCFVFVLDLVSRLMDRGRTPFRSSPSSSLSLSLWDFFLSKWSKRRRGDDHWFSVLKLYGFRESFLSRALRSLFLPFYNFVSDSSACDFTQFPSIIDANEKYLLMLDYYYFHRWMG